MLAGLNIRDIVLIEKLDLFFDAGLTVLTGETGAGKSILLDSLGLALGARADRALVRSGQTQGSVTAEFNVSPDSPVCLHLREQGMDDGAGQVIFRRQITSDGRSRAWVNDQPVSQGLLSELGDMLVEVHGQHDDRVLMDTAAHRDLLDMFAGAGGLIEAVEVNWQAHREAGKALAAAEADLAAARKDEEFLRHAVAELETLSPASGEEEELAERRTLMMQGEKLVDDLNSYQAELASDGGVDAILRGVLRRMDRADSSVADLLTPVVDAFDRAAIELSEGLAALDKLQQELEFNPQELEQLEERLFELRRLARKHNCQPDDLPVLYGQLKEKLAALDAGDDHVAAARKGYEAASLAFKKTVEALSGARQKAASRLDVLVTAELPPLKLEKAQFRTSLEVLPEQEWGAFGGDRVCFEVKTNPGTPFGPLIKIASGGEQARFILALKVVLAKGATTPVMVFDEVDRGIGGATASAVGDRLKRLSETAQVLVVTHSPQVAARGDTQYQITKQDLGGTTRTNVQELEVAERKEEIARMLAGAEITNEARAAAERLLQQEG